MSENHPDLRRFLSDVILGFGDHLECCVTGEKIEPGDKVRWFAYQRPSPDGEHDHLRWSVGRISAAETGIPVPGERMRGIPQAAGGGRLAVEALPVRGQYRPVLGVEDVSIWSVLEVQEI